MALFVGILFGRVLWFVSGSRSKRGRWRPFSGAPPSIYPSNSPFDLSPLNPQPVRLRVRYRVNSRLPTQAGLGGVPVRSALTCKD
jgi:hypothetical protein